MVTKVSALTPQAFTINPGALSLFEVIVGSTRIDAGELLDNADVEIRGFVPSRVYLIIVPGISQLICKVKLL